jgi:hypothetical protein
MALFGGRRDAKFLASVNRELLNAIVDTEIEFFKLIVEQSNSNIYGESDSKAYYNSILIPCLVTKEGKTANMDDYGHTYTRTAQFGVSRDILERADFYPEVGDIILWDNEYYEVDNLSQDAKNITDEDEYEIQIKLTEEYISLLNIKNSILDKKLNVYMKLKIN